MPEKLSLKEIKSRVRKEGYFCLSKEYHDAKTPILVRCKNKHIWRTDYSHFKSGHRCPYCKKEDRKQKTFHRIKKIAESKSGECISKKYVDNKTRLEFKCQKNHIWKATPKAIMKGRWCHACAGNKPLTLEDGQIIARRNNGKCLSKKYVNSNTKLKWQCTNGHHWSATIRNITRGTWCPECAKKLMGAPKLSIREIRKRAEELGFELLSTKYESAQKKLKFRCKSITFAIPPNKNRSIGCRKCNQRLHERICRYIFGRIFKKSFNPCRPPDLVSPRGFLMEIDGYCPELKLAFEYHGGQHYREIEMFDRKRSLSERKKYDEIKRLYCAKRNIKLIEISEDIIPDEMYNYIIQECKKKNVRIPEKALKKRIKIPLLTGYCNEKLEEAKKVAKSKDGECLSTTYIDSETKLTFQCEKKHVWNANLPNIRHTWCPYCAKNRLLIIKDMQKLAKAHNGKCLSKKYVNNHTKLKWLCENSHVWEAVPSSIAMGSWCPDCALTRRGASQRLTIEEMHKIAESRGGKCLSKKYVNSHTKLQWVCKKGHVWEAVPLSIKHGYWCSVCAGNKKLTILDAQKIAKSRGSECISKVYTNARTPLKWRCKNKHDWKATLSSVKGSNKRKGTWCPKCAIIKRNNIFMS